MQACPRAITIRLVDVANQRGSGEGRIWSGAFDSSYTKPTTKYFSKRGCRRMPNRPRARSTARTCHWPLIVMLLLSQLPRGFFDLATMGGAVVSSFFVTRLCQRRRLLALNAGWRPHHSSRPAPRRVAVFPGLRTSWMSREILAFGIVCGDGLCGNGSLLDRQVPRMLWPDWRELPSPAWRRSLPPS